MKKIENDHINSIVNNFLKRRSYMDTKHNSSTDEIKCGLNQSVHRKCPASGSLLNSVSYSNISSDPSSCDQQFTRFRHFINELSPQNELRELLFPLFTHLYLDLLYNGHVAPAHKFYGRYITLFKDNKRYSGYIQVLELAQNLGDIHTNKSLSNFRCQKHQLEVSQSSLDHLFMYLKNDDNMNIIQVINQRIHISVKPSISETGYESLSQGHSSVCSSSVDHDSHNENQLSALKSVINSVKSLPPTSPSIYLISVETTDSGVCSTDVLNERLVAGLEDSSIRVWSLTPECFPVDECEGDVSRIKLAADFYISHKEAPTTRLKSSNYICMQGHNGSVYKVAFLPNPSHILSCSEDTTVRLWDVSSRRNVVKYSGHTGPVWDLDLENNTGLFATASSDTTAKLWVTDRICSLRSFVGHTADVNCVKFHPNGSYLASGSTDQTVRLWNTVDAKCLRLFTGHRGTVFVLEFSSDGKYLASAGEDNCIKIWDLASGKLYHELVHHSDVVYSLRFNHDSSLLISGGLDGTLCIWNFQNVIKCLESDPFVAVSHKPLATFQIDKCITSLKYKNHGILYVVGTQL